jgi:hypothetical protein
MNTLETCDFKTFLSDGDWLEFNEVLHQLITNIENNPLNESILFNEGLIDKLSSKLKGGIAFIKQFAELVGGKLLDFLKMFKNKVLFTFFNKIKWSIKELSGIVKKGYSLFKNMQGIIDQFIKDNNIIQWTNDKLTLLDNFLNNHPVLKRVGSLIIVGFLIYQWTSMISFTSDIEFDFDQTLLFDAIRGAYSMADLLATPDGLKMLLFIAIGVLTGVSFPWPGNTWVLFTISILYTVSKHKHPSLATKLINSVKKYKSIKV